MLRDRLELARAAHVENLGVGRSEGEAEDEEPSPLGAGDDPEPAANSCVAPTEFAQFCAAEGIKTHWTTF